MYSRGGNGFSTPYGNRPPTPRFGEGIAGHSPHRGMSPSFGSPPPVGSFGTPPPPPPRDAVRWQSSPNQSFGGHRPATPRAYGDYFSRSPSPYGGRPPSPYGGQPPSPYGGQPHSPYGRPGLPPRGGGAYSPRFFRGQSDGRRRTPQSRGGDENPGGSGNVMDYYNSNMLKDPWQGMTPVPARWPN